MRVPSLTPSYDDDVVRNRSVRAARRGTGRRLALRSRSGFTCGLYCVMLSMMYRRTLLTACAVPLFIAFGGAKVHNGDCDYSKPLQAAAVKVGDFIRYSNWRDSGPKTFRIKAVRTYSNGGFSIYHEL